MLASRDRLVWLRQIFGRIADLLDNARDVDIALAVIMIGGLAQEIRGRRHARTRADAHVETAIEEELFDLRAGPIDADRRAVVVTGAARDRVDQRLDDEGGEFTAHGLAAASGGGASLSSFGEEKAFAPQIERFEFGRAQEAVHVVSGRLPVDLCDRAPQSFVQPHRVDGNVVIARPRASLDKRRPQKRQIGRHAFGDIQGEIEPIPAFEKSPAKEGMNLECEIGR